MAYYIYKRKKNMLGFKSLILKKDKVPFRKGDIVYITDSYDNLHSRWYVNLEDSKAVKLVKSPDDRTVSLNYKDLVDYKEKKIYEISKEESAIIDKYFIHKINIYPFYDINSDSLETNYILDELRKKDYDFEIFTNVNYNNDNIFERYNLIISKNYGVVVFKCFDLDLLNDNDMLKKLIDDINSDFIYRGLCSSSFLTDNGIINVNYKRFYIFESHDYNKIEKINSKLDIHNMICDKKSFIEEIDKNVKIVDDKNFVNKDKHFGILQMLLPQYTNSKIENVVKKNLKFMPDQSYELDKTQMEIMASLNERYYLMASAGTGKTVLLLAKAYEVAYSNPDKEFLYICFNAKLVEDVKNLAENTGKVISNLKICTFDKFIEENYSQLKCDTVNETFKIRRKEFVNKVNLGKISKYYGGIFIDEMQQLAEEHIAAFLELLDGNKYMLIAGDYNQQISDLSEEYDFDDEEDSDEIVDDDFYIASYNFKKVALPKNYRNSKKIFNVINKMVSRINDYSEMLEIPSLKEQNLKTTNESSFTSDDDPEYFAISDLSKEVTFIYEKIIDLLYNRGFNENDILILVPQIKKNKDNKIYVISKLEELFYKNGIEYCDFTDKSLSKDGIRIGTIGKSIGLDYKAVILCGMSESRSFKNEFKSLKILMDENIKTKKDFIKNLKYIYVACSRAREVLMVVDDLNQYHNTNLVSLFLKIVGDKNGR